MAEPKPEIERSTYAGEVRFGVVMYGGVSLAIYINGVANELYEMCCATPKVDGAAVDPGSTRAVYRKLSWLLRSEELRRRYGLFLASRKPEDDPFDPACDPVDAALRQERQRLVVDVIAGTSAGGINGIFLAKALANGEAFAPLKDLWIKEGDIASLLNDKHSWTQEIKFADRELPPNSLLNSDRMYLKLLHAMQAMEPAMAGIGLGESALSDEIDLFVTTTDIRGTVVPIRLFDNVVYEKRHKQVYHFNYLGAGGLALSNDFRRDNLALLAFSARCTSSFPFAFEPMQVADAARLARAGSKPATVKLDDWKPYFTGLSHADLSGEGWTRRAFGDGGYLDNKPFSYAVEALSWRLASVPMERKLIYVEPAPAHPELEAQEAANKPDAIENAVAALTKIPQYETIREDLENVLKRNRRIERVERIVRKVEADVDAMPGEPFDRVMIRRADNGQDRAEVPDWSTLDLGRMIDYYGAAFLPYWRLRLTTVSDDLADRLADRWGVDRRSDRMYAMRALVRAWRERAYYETKARPGSEQEEKDKDKRSVNAFVAAFDIKYRVRRAGFLLRRTHMLLRLAQQRLAAQTGAAPATESDAEKALRERLERRVYAYEKTDAKAWYGALLVLRKHLAVAQTEIRRLAWPTSAEAGRSGSDTEREQLDQVLGLLMGETLSKPLTALPSHDDAKRLVPLKLGAMPLPSPLRTLQENVYARALGLFAAADAGALTELQHLLQTDILDLAAHYASATSAGSSGTALLIKQLLGLGEPALLPVPVTNQPERLCIEINLGDVQADPAIADPLNTFEGRSLRRFLAEYYLRFDEYDQVSFPLYYDTGTGEPATVEVVRISPEDAPSLIDEKNSKRRKLAGTFLANFGGFLDEQWRRNDIMWGRLDASERLLATLLPAQQDKALRDALLGQAQRAILKEEMTQPYYDELLAQFSLALRSQGQQTLQQNFETLLAALRLDDGARGTRWALALQSVFDDQGLFEFVQKHYEVRRELDTETALKTGARALTITGRILEQIEKRKRASGSRMVWVTRAGRALQALLTVATPGSLPKRLFQHWLALLYAFEIAVAAGALVLGAQGTRDFALSAFVITLVLHLATLVTGDLLVRAETRHIAAKKAAAEAKKTTEGAEAATVSGSPPVTKAADGAPWRATWALRIVAALMLLVLLLAAAGVAGFAHYGFVPLLCGPLDHPPDGVAGWICSHLTRLR